MALSKVVLEICEEMDVEVDRVPELILGDSSSLRDLVEGAGLVSPSFSLSSSRWRVFSTWMIDMSMIRSHVFRGWGRDVPSKSNQGF